MYRHCPSCTRDLGANEALERFPVGRRLAYDTERGRLWVLCSGCRGWNLAPIEERWEALEDAERLFETAEQGISTENISMARIREGTELIRIGRAEAPEVASWRYAQRISKRWKRARWASGMGTATWFLWASGGMSFLGGAPLLLLAAGGLGVGVHGALQRRRRVVQVDGPHRELRGGELGRLLLMPVGPDEPGSDGWGLELRSTLHEPIRIPSELRNRALRLAFLDLNRDVGRPQELDAALQRVSDAGGPARIPLLAAQSLDEGKSWSHHMGWPFDYRHALRRADPVLRLALEIAANEDSERVALEGELHRLELEWRDAEELAAIEDSLLVPAWVRRRLREWRSSDGDGEGATER